MENIGISLKLFLKEELFCQGYKMIIGILKSLNSRLLYLDQPLYVPTVDFFLRSDAKKKEKINIKEIF